MNKINTVSLDNKDTVILGKLLVTTYYVNVTDTIEPGHVNTRFFNIPGSYTASVNVIFIGQYLNGSTGNVTIEVGSHHISAPVDHYL